VRREDSSACRRTADQFRVFLSNDTVVNTARSHDVNLVLDANCIRTARSSHLWQIEQNSPGRDISGRRQQYPRQANTKAGERHGRDKRGPRRNIAETPSSRTGGRMRGTYASCLSPSEIAMPNDPALRPGILACLRAFGGDIFRLSRAKTGQNGRNGRRNGSDQSASSITIGW
jgi:hypothetical protein